jgi:hypothetical protein
MPITTLLVLTRVSDIMRPLSLRAFLGVNNGFNYSIIKQTIKSDLKQSGGFSFADKIKHQAKGQANQAENLKIIQT